MPVYEFECNQCDHHFDRLQKLSESDPSHCPDCGAPSVRRRVSAPFFRLAGSGWYETDFKNAADKKQNLVDGGEKKADQSEPASGSAAESKPAATSSGADGSSSDQKTRSVPASEVGMATRPTTG